MTHFYYLPPRLTVMARNSLSRPFGKANSTLANQRVECYQDHTAASHPRQCHREEGKRPAVEKQSIIYIDYLYLLHVIIKQ